MPIYNSPTGSGAVDSVNAQTGVVVLDQDDIGNGTTYKQTTNDYTTAEKSKLSGIATGADVTGDNAPQAHNSSHQSGGGDAIKLDDLATPDDNTDLNASATAHGLLLKLENSGTKYLRDDGTWQTVSASGGGLLTKEITIENPNSSEDVSWFYTDVAITVTAAKAVLNGGASTPTIDINIYHNTDRSAAGNTVDSSDKTVTSISTGDAMALNDDVTIPANSYVWIETANQSGTVPELFIYLKCSID